MQYLDFKIVTLAKKKKSAVHITGIKHLASKKRRKRRKRTRKGQSKGRRQ